MIGLAVRMIRGSILLVPAAIVHMSCGRTGTPPLIGYPERWIGSAISQVAQQSIDAWGQPRVARIPDSLMAAFHVRPGLAGDVDYAAALAALPGIAAVVGPQSSRAALLVAPIYAEHAVPMIVATGTSRLLRDMNPWVFQLAPDDAAEGDFLARFILNDLTARRVTIFYLVADEYGLGLRDGLVQALDRRGVTPVDQVGIIETTDFPRRVAQSLARARPDVVVVAARGPETAGLIRALRDRLPLAPVVVGDGVPLNSDFVAELRTAAASVYGVTWWHPDLPDTASREFARAFRAVSSKSPSAADAMYYDAIMLEAQAIRDVGADRHAIRRYLSDLGTARPAYRGITGPIAFGADRPVNLVMTRVVGGRTVIVPVTEDGP